VNGGGSIFPALPWRFAAGIARFAVALPTAGFAVPICPKCEGIGSQRGVVDADEPHTDGATESGEPASAGLKALCSIAGFDKDCVASEADQFWPPTSL
jgi:hypothetical protein